jgi:response regulator RpfG family c-di-GMP phosphodiesterase
MVMEKQESWEKQRRKLHNNRMKWVVLLCLFGFVLNYACNFIVNLLGFPLYMDTIGTIFTAWLGGSLPGVFVALCTNLILGFGNPESIYFGILNVLIAVVTAFWVQSPKRRHRVGWMMLLTFLYACIGGGLGAIQTWVFDGFSMDGANGFLIRFFYESMQLGAFWAQFLAAFLFDLLDKALSLTGCVLLLLAMPADVKAKLRLTGWRQKPLVDEKLAEVRRARCRKISLGTKIIAVLMLAFVTIAVGVTGISLMLFQNFSKEQHSDLSRGVARMAASVIDADRVSEYLEKGEAAEGYLETKEMLQKIRDTYSDVEYLYVYQIREDGCHVVFDLDTEEMPGEEPGTVIDFDPAFEPYLDQLLRGENIDTIVSNDTYGWLLTEYEPVYDSKGNCVCYAASDIAMNDVRRYEVDFFVKLASLFLGFFALLLAIGLWLSTYHLVYPINSMAYAASAFAYNSEEAREQNVEQIRELDIHTGDELENLYLAFAKTTEDSARYFVEMQHKAEMISLLQSGLIMVLADMVENRDQSTGDHVRKTAAYVNIILKQLRAMGYYQDQLTDQYMQDVVRSAPLHDVGKIQVSDAILNKPGKLTEDEFEQMKKHTLAGQKILQQAIETMPEADYLKEAMNLATYHHEKWNGKGYPYGLAGEDIPLSARVMAVADVFDALVSKRCYKEPFTFEKAISIIQEGSGNHFDPKVVEAFLASEEEVRAVAERFEHQGPGLNQELWNKIS